MVDHGAATSNAELVENLRRGGILETDRCVRALLACPRDHFIHPIAEGAYRAEALIDAPIRVEELDFNISAPHMHATCIEALSLSPGHSVLDVGSGCGVLTAALAHAVGKEGSVVGIDIRRECITLCRQNIQRLISATPLNQTDFASTAAPIKFELANIFIPPPHHIGKYDRIHVGASCPPDRLSPLLKLLRPEGGLIVVPVAPSDLRVVTKRSSGVVSQRVISQVRFSELEIPTDAEILLATVRADRKARSSVPSIPSTYHQDLEMLLKGDGYSLKGMVSTQSSLSSQEDQQAMSSTPKSPSGVIDGFPKSYESEKPWPLRLGKLLTSCGSSGVHDGGDILMVDSSCILPSSHSTTFDVSLLGEPDLMLVGAGWHIPVHKALLKRRCEHLRARCDSGMRDAMSSIVSVPEHFSKTTMDSFLHYVYKDAIELDITHDPQSIIALLHVAQYYGTPRLTHLCELALAKVIQRKIPVKGKSDQDEDSRAEAAAALFGLAANQGLPHLKAVALDYVVHHFEAVSKTEAFGALGKEEVALVAAESCAYLSNIIKRMKDMVESGDHKDLPEPSY